MKEITRWNYRGLRCGIMPTETGWLYEVTEIGLITKHSYIVLYGGRHGEPFTKEEVNNMIDDKLSNCKVSTSCSYYQDSYEKGSCFFSESGCCDDNCIMHMEEKDVIIDDLKDTISDLEEEIKYLENGSVM